RQDEAAGPGSLYARRSTLLLAAAEQPFPAGLRCRQHRLSDHGSRRAAGLPGYSEDAGALLCLRQHGHGTGTQPGDEHLRAPALYPARRAAADDPGVREEWRAPSADPNGQLHARTCAAGMTAIDPDRYGYQIV